MNGPICNFSQHYEVQEIATEWLWTYNHERPNVGIWRHHTHQKLKMAA
ncbi:hypothetical protein ACVMH6_000142 [Rhizobium leguminosarum]